MATASTHPEQDPTMFYRETGRNLAFVSAHLEAQARLTAEALANHGGETTRDIFLFAVHGVHERWATTHGLHLPIVDRYDALEERFKGRSTFPIATMWRHPLSRSADWLLTGVGMASCGWVATDEAPVRYTIEKKPKGEWPYVGRVLLPVVDWVDLSGHQPGDTVTGSGPRELELAVIQGEPRVLEEPYQNLVMDWQPIFAHRQPGSGANHEYDLLHVSRAEAARQYFNRQRAAGAYRHQPQSQSAQSMLA